MKLEFIWYCPRRCHSIITKTTEPLLPRKKIWKCKRCNEQYSSEFLINENKKNIKKYLDSIIDINK